ncbi:MAG: hypothetical protein ACYTEX_19215 [Planctomycetota bacterium]
MVGRFLPKTHQNFPTFARFFPLWSGFRSIGGQKKRSKSPKSSPFGPVLAPFGAVFDPCQEEQAPFSNQKRT